MAKMIPFTAPAQHALGQGLFLQATSAGRYGDGLRTTVTLGKQVDGGDHASPLYAETFSISSTKDRQRVAQQFSTVSQIPADVLEGELIEFASALEQVLSDIETSVIEEEEERANQDSQATLLIKLAEEQSNAFFHFQDIAYVKVPFGDHVEIYRLREQKYRRYLSRLHHEKTDRAPGSQAVQDALAVLEGKAFFDGLELPVHLRVAEHGETIYLDLANDAWQCVRITSESWNVISESPVRFRRTRGMEPLPVPLDGGNIDDLKPFINLIWDPADDWRLLISWLTMALRPTGPYPILTLFGEQGSGKSTLSRMLRLLIDPNLALVRSSPREERDLVITAGNCHLIALDNISRLPEWLSDALCRVATGAGFATRQLFTDAEEMLFQAQRPIILNGIEEFAQRPDLVDRAIILQLPQIDKQRRQHEKAMNAEFEAKRPQILGALLDIICIGLAMIDDVELAASPRMADFARWGCAIAEGCGWKQQDFLDAYERNRQRANEASIESSIVATELMKFLAAHGAWEGRATDLLEALNDSTSEEIRKRKDWPKQPNVLSNVLRRIAPSLRERGVGCAFDRSTQRTITLTPAPAG